MMTIDHMGLGELKIVYLFIAAKQCMVIMWKAQDTTNCGQNYSIKSALIPNSAVHGQNSH